MDTSFIPVEVVPSKGVFGLDQLRRSYKSSLSAEAAVATAPAIGTADETFADLFLVSVNTPESAETATRIDLVYQGSFSGGLPDPKHTEGASVQSASSSATVTGIPFTNSVTVQFYAPENTLSYISRGGVGTDAAADPDRDIEIITIGLGSAALMGLDFDSIVPVNFVERIIATSNAQEIVPGQYWQNESRKTKVLQGSAVEVNSDGFYLQITANGSGYSVSDTLTFSFGGESAVVTITAVLPSGGVAAWDVTSNTFTAAASAVAATGGGGSGCIANVVSI